MNEHGIVLRIRLVFLGLLLLAVAVACRFVYLHTSNDTKEQRLYQVKLLANRGSIYDRLENSAPMAESLSAWQVFIDPKSVREDADIPWLSAQLARSLGLDAREVEKKFVFAGSRYVKLGITSDIELYDSIRTNSAFRGVATEDVTIRRYPYGRCMSHVLGFVNAVNVGGAGIEQSYNSFLSGTEGMILGEKDSARREIVSRRMVDTPAIAGHNIHLTLDRNIQQFVEEALRNAVTTNNAIRGWALVEKVSTGELLAVATYPDFEPANYADYTRTMTRAEWEELMCKNYALTSIYEPGSVMKSLTCCAFLNEKLGTPQTIFDAEQGSWAYAGKILHDHPTGKMDLGTALAKSSNIVYAKVGLALGDERLYRYMRAFNLGSKFGIGMPGEERGLLPRPGTRGWSKLTPTRISIGQGVSVSALQLISIYSCIANDGVMMKPHLLKKIVSAEGEIVQENRPEVVGRPISAKVARDVRNMLRGTVQPGGTARRARVRGYSVAGKTGTSQKVINGQYSSSDYWASFVGMLPVDKPEFVVLVTVDSPKPIHTGGYVSAPAFAAIASRTARYLEIPPDVPEDVVEEVDESEEAAGYRSYEFFDD